jgi:predicted ATP-dependent endonuclease of OLD family
MIKKIKIQNFRSIIKLELIIDDKGNFITLCGPNNVGKTNILNALSLYFDESIYIAKKDCPHHKYYGTQGGNYQPKITVDFLEGTDIYSITKDWNVTKKEREDLEYDYKLNGKKNKDQLLEREIKEYLIKLNFFYLESINLSFPETIKYIMNKDIIDLETGKSRLSGKKKEMKENIEKVLEDLDLILNTLGQTISPLLENYKSGWGLAFDLPKEVNTFRDLMIGEIEFYIKDKSNSKEIDAKGSGLQRLCHILMHFRIIEKLNEKNEKVILLIDEPDVYLHSGLQKKLLKDIKKYSDKNQIFITTHSPLFIDTNKLLNVFLVDQEIVEDKEFARGKRKKIGSKKFNVVSTELINIDNTNGITKLKEYLGIEDNDYLLFDKYNVLVEGEEDKKYLSKLMNVFGIEVPNIISSNGADNILKYLEFYNSLSEKKQNIKFQVILDNDKKGRDVYTKIKNKKFENITVSIKFIINYFGYEYKNEENDKNVNIEIEDFIKPEILCSLSNIILDKKKFKKFSKRDIDLISKNIAKPAFQSSGILSLLENKKNELNPDNGQEISFSSNGIKGGLANLFMKVDKDIIDLIGEKETDTNKFIVEFLENISGKTKTTLF